MNNLFKKATNKAWRYFYRATQNKHVLNKLINSDDPRLQKMAQIFQDALKGNLSSEEKKVRDQVEQLRANLIQKDARIAANNDETDPSTDSAAKIARSGSKNEQWGVLLMKLITNFGLQKGLEFGTCLGISGSYQGGGMKINDGQLVTMEGNVARKELSEQHFAKLGLGNVEAHAGAFEEILPGVLEQHNKFDYLFIDGDHRHKATVQNFEKVLPYLKENAIVVVDDIKWSEGMKRAWKEIKVNNKVAYVFDLFIVGICIIGESDEQQEFKISLW